MNDHLNTMISEERLPTKVSFSSAFSNSMLMMLKVGHPGLPKIVAQFVMFVF